MPNEMDRPVHEHWNIDGLVADLRAAEWEQTEPHRQDRRVWLGTYRAIVDLTQRAVSKEEWAESARNDYREELLDEYMDAVSRAVSANMGEHVYASFEDGDAFVGQYREEDREKPGPMDWYPSE